MVFQTGPISLGRIDPWPNAYTTGLIPGIPLTPSGSLNLGTNQVIQNLDISGTVTLTGNGGSIINCRINPNYDFNGVIGDNFNFTVRHCEIFNCTAVGVTINGGSVTYCNMYNSTKCVGPGNNCIIQFNYMHDLQGQNSLAGHFECIDIPGPLSNVLIANNRMEAFDTACVFIKTDGGAISNVTIDSNLMISTPGQSYSQAMYSLDTGPGVSGVVCTNNVMQAGFSGSYGDIEGNHVNWANNTDYFTGALIPNPGP
jgi:hypothetical protein